MIRRKPGGFEFGTASKSAIVDSGAEDHAFEHISMFRHLSSDKVILTNAFVDVLSTMSNPSLYLTEHEYDEFGNPGADPILYEIIRSYCPIYNLDPVLQSQKTRTQYLLIGTLDDTNVPYWNASLYFRKLLKGFAKVPATMDGDNATVDTDVNRQYPENNRVFLDLQTDGGHHFSAANRVDVLALENAFILKA